MSGRKNILPPHLLIEAEGLDAAWSSDPVTITTATHIVFNIATAGVTDNTGTFGVEYRVYKDDRQSSAYCALSLSSTPTLADANAVHLLDLRLPPGQVRITFTPVGGTPDGTATVWVTGNSEG